MTDERRPDVDELLSLVEGPAPLPEGVEDALWRSTAEFYEHITQSPNHDAPTHDTDKEILMLTPNRNQPADRRRTWLLAGAAALVALLVAGLAIFVPDWDDGSEPVTTQTPTTSVAPTVPEPGYEGIVWENDIDPTRVNATEGRPELVEDPLSMRVDSLIVTPGPEDSPLCAAAVEEGATDIGGNPQELPEITSCLFVEFRFDVAESAGAGRNGIVGAQPGVTTNGDEIVLLTTDEGFAASGDSATGSAVFGNLGPGSTVSLLYSIDLEDGVLFDRWEFEIPDALQPIDWFAEDG